MGYENAPDVRGRGPSLGVTVIGLDQRAQQCEPGALLGVELADAIQESHEVREHQQHAEQHAKAHGGRQWPHEDRGVQQGRAGQERDLQDHAPEHRCQRLELADFLNPRHELQELLHFFLLKPGCSSRTQTNNLYYTSINTKSQYTLYW